jgi:hypothetical protein
MVFVMLGRHTYIHTAESLVCEPRAFDFEMTTEKLNSHRSLSTDQIPAEMIKAEGRTIRSEFI